MYISAMLNQNMKDVLVWERKSINERVTKTYPAPFYFYIPDENGTYTDIFNNKLGKLEFNSFKQFKESKERFKYSGVKLYESDIGAEFKILSQEYYGTPVPKLNMTFLDIEVDYDPSIGYSMPENPYAPINAISIYHHYSDEMVVLAIPSKKFKNKPLSPELHKQAKILLFSNEKELLTEFYEQIENSDLLSGWNSDTFDMPYIYERTNKTLGKGQGKRLCFDNTRDPKYKEVNSKFGTKQQVLQIFGRISVDYIELFKKFEASNRQSYALEMVAEEELPHLPKLEYDGSLHKLYNDDFEQFIRYNIRDSEILKGFEQKFGYAQLAIHMTHSETGLVNNIMGTIKLAELALINKCHYELNKIVPDSMGYNEDEDNEKYAGALVLPPQIGMHKNAAAVDIISLYPSAMRTLNISPETIIGQFFENEEGFEQILSKSTKDLTLQLEDGTLLTKTGEEWSDWLKSNTYAVSGYGTVFTQKFDGVIPSILASWFNERVEYKGKYAQAKDKASKETDPIEKAKLLEYASYCDRVQYIKKIQLNSMYGALGNKYFKFYDVRLAESTTRSGREVLMHMVRTIAEILDGNYAYPSESMIYSDTDSAYFKTHTETHDDAIQIAKSVEKIVNKSFKTFTKEFFLCSEKFSNMIMAELDIVAANSIFVKKKMYIMDLIYKGGKKTSETKIMGLRIKKTTLPKPIRNKLSSFVLEILKDVDWRVTSEKIVDYKEELSLTENILEVGLPLGVKKVAEYTENYNTDPKTRLPGHVAASIFWNICLDQYKDKESLPIVSGTKIKVFYLTKKFGRFNSIAIPTDAKFIPDWFKENFYGIVDRPKQTEKLVDKSLEGILKAIDRLIPTRKLLLYYDVLSD